MLIRSEEITANGFLDIFKKIVKKKEAAGIIAIQNNPKDLFDRSKSYGIHYKNGSWG